MSGGCWTKFQHTKPSHKHKMWVWLNTAAMHDLQRAGYSKLLLAIVCFCRKVELSEGLRLLQPRLIAGVSVAHVPSPVTGKQTKKPINGFHRGRLAARRKS